MFPSTSFRENQDSRENKTNPFARDHTLSAMIYIKTFS